VIAAQAPAPGLAGLDPGRSKCGLVLADGSGSRVLAAAILSPKATETLLRRWQGQGLQGVILGSGTGSGPWQSRLADLGSPVWTVEEWGTTLAARDRYWQLDGSRSWRRWLPAGLRLPPRDLDDVVAQLLLERHLGRELRRDRQLPLWRDLP
jgi:hypothetical protein